MSIVWVQKKQKIASAGSDQESADNFYEKKCGEYGYVIFWNFCNRKHFSLKLWLCCYSLRWSHRCNCSKWTDNTVKPRFQRSDVIPEIFKWIYPCNMLPTHSPYCCRKYCPLQLLQTHLSQDVFPNTAVTHISPSFICANTSPFILCISCRQM